MFSSGHSGGPETCRTIRMPFPDVEKLGRHPRGIFSIVFTHLVNFPDFNFSDVASTVAQRRERDSDDTNPEQRVFPEPMVGDHFLQVPVRCSHQPDRPASGLTR